MLGYGECGHDFLGCEDLLMFGACSDVQSLDLADHLADCNLETHYVPSP